MTIRKYVARVAAGALVLCGAALGPTGARAASIDQQFKKSIERLLMNLKDGPVAEMSQQERKELAACVNGVFASVSEEKKRSVVEAKGFDEMRARFDAIGLEDRARLKQQVRDDCA